MGGIAGVGSEAFVGGGGGGDGEEGGIMLTMASVNSSFPAASSRASSAERVNLFTVAFQ